jgi:DNA-binding protein YbaB
MLDKNRDLKILLLKNITFDVLENDSSISVEINEEGQKILQKIKIDEPDWREDLFIDSVVRSALEEAVKDITDENKS